MTPAGAHRRGASAQIAIPIVTAHACVVTTNIQSIGNPPRTLRYATVGKGRFELPTSRSRTAHSNLAELLPGARNG
jgi:hypothetical protein